MIPVNEVYVGSTAKRVRGRLLEEKASVAIAVVEDESG